MNRDKKQEQLKYIALTSVMAAMTYVLTAFLHIPTHEGYVHIGDGMIYLSATLLPTPYAMAVGTIGAGLSDLLSGYVMWVLPTAIIKALTAACFSRKKENIVCTRNIIALVPAGIICVGGYYLSSGIMYGDFIAAFADVPSNCIQIGASIILYLVLGFALDRMGFKKRFLSYNAKKQTA